MFVFVWQMGWETENITQGKKKNDKINISCFVIL